MELESPSQRDVATDRHPNELGLDRLCRKIGGAKKLSLPQRSSGSYAKVIRDGHARILRLDAGHFAFQLPLQPGHKAVVDAENGAIAADIDVKLGVEDFHALVLLTEVNVGCSRNSGVHDVADSDLVDVAFLEPQKRQVVVDEAHGDIKRIARVRKGELAYRIEQTMGNP